VFVLRAARVTMCMAVRMRVAGTAMLIAVSVAAGPVPVLVHEPRIRRLAMADQRVKPTLAGAGFRRHRDRNCSAA
jgi:hypothetical protein